MMPHRHLLMDTPRREAFSHHVHPVLLLRDHPCDERVQP